MSSVPTPGLRVSFPAPASRLSLPGPPLSESAPSRLVSVSSLLPPSRVLSPPIPARVSFPVPPMKTFAAEVPVMESLLMPPVMFSTSVTLSRREPLSSWTPPSLATLSGVNVSGSRAGRIAGLVDAVAAQQIVGAGGAAVERVVAGPGVQAVVARAAVEGVGAPEARQRVVARAGVEVLLPAPASRSSSSLPPLRESLPPRLVERVVAVAAVEDVGVPRPRPGCRCRHHRPGCRCRRSR